MAIDKAVDSTALDSALTDIANAIRTKTGGTDPLTLEQMPGEIKGIETGTAGIPFDSVSSFTYYPAGQYPDGNFVGSFPHATSLNFPNSKLTSIDVTVTSSLLSFSLQPNSYSVKEVTIRGDMSGVKKLYRAFATVGAALGANHIEKVYGLDFTSVTDAAAIFGGALGLTTITIKPNTVNIALQIPDCKNLTVESCINILNALKDRTDKNALTLTCHADLKTANTGRLYVNYVKLDANTGLYVSCEQTDDGAMTIADAIIAKNWTIAGGDKNES